MGAVTFLRLLSSMTLLTAVLTSSEADDTVIMQQSDDVNSAAQQTLGEPLESCQESLVSKNYLQAELASLRSKVEQLENNEESLKQTISQLEDSLHDLKTSVSRAVAFTARISLDRDPYMHGQPLSHHQTVIFNEVFNNVGNAFNAYTGIFTAPVDGTYAFFLTLMGVTNQAPRSEDVYLAIVKDGETLDLVMAHGGKNFHDQGSTHVTTHLQKGEQVWVRHASGNAVRGDKWTVFTGYLLQADI